MAMFIQEFCGDNHGISTSIVEDENLGVGLNVAESGNSPLPIDPNSINVDVEGIHAFPHATRNFTRYMPKCLKNSVESWTNPYNRPLIKHHNEKNGKIIGRVLNAEYITRQTFSGTPALLFTVNVPSEEAKNEIKNGTESTVSIGVIAHDVRCSICGQQLAGGETCEHERGVTYNGETCYWDIHSMEAKELSYVIVPSDVYAKNRKIYTATTKSGEKTQITESLDDSIKKGEQKQMAAEEIQKELTEAKAKITTLEATVSELTEAKKASEKTVTELTEAKSALEKQVAELTEAKATLEQQAKDEAVLKEGLESSLEETKVALKNSLVETMQALRKAAGKKELDAETIKNRSEDSLNDAIMDLKEEMTSTEASHPASTAPEAGSVKDPTLQENEDEHAGGKNVTESNENEKIDLEAGLNQLLTGMVSFHK